ncbi:hypothetical protein N7523_005140 [Penicillium sp. IBT 18751x]|nr:hypothetical protein N7523_005140 [Penicillium sp. IBT 18751x]
MRMVSVQYGSYGPETLMQFPGRQGDSSRIAQYGRHKLSIMVARGNLAEEGGQDSPPGDKLRKSLVASSLRCQ